MKECTSLNCLKPLNYIGATTSRYTKLDSVRQFCFTRDNNGSKITEGKWQKFCC